MDDLERIVQSAARGFAEGLLLRLSPPQEVTRPKNSRRRSNRATPKVRQPVQAPLPFTPVQGNMDDYEGAPTVQELDAMFPEGSAASEQVQQLRRQMEMQKAAAQATPPQPPPPPPVTSWGISERS